MDEQLEAAVAGITAKFVQHCEARKERCRLGEIVGSVFLVKVRGVTIAG